MLRQAAPDVIHVHDHPGLATALAVRRPGTAVVYDAHEHTLGKDLNPTRRPDLERYLRRHAPKADAVITVGSAIAELLVRELGLPDPPTIVHNTPSLRAAKPAPYDLRAVVGVDAATPLVVYTGSLPRRRRLDTVLRALVDLPGVHLAAVLVQERPELVAAGQELGIEDRVHFPPPVPHDSLVSLIRGADVGVNPLDRYANGDVAMPNKLFEYLHAEVPMVVSDSPQMAAFVREHRLGEVAPADDPGAWAQAIARILANPAAYRGDPAARERLRRRWSWEAEEAALLGLYERLVASRSSR
jgi:glycosyltransferase involved in cell wall biosynthesis